MAIGWISALKVIPWGDVIDAAPVVVKGAKKFFNRTQALDPEPVAEAPVAAGSDPLAAAQARLRQLEARVAELAEAQQASAALLAQLAEQNAKVVGAIDILRVRSRMLLIASGAMGLALLGLGGWVLLR